MFFLTFFSQLLANFWQTLRGPFSAASKPIFASKKYSLESSRRDLQDLETFVPFDSNLNKLLHLGTPIRKPRKTLLASVLRTKLTAPERKPSDRSKAAWPGGVAKRKCTRHAALTVRVGAALSQKIYAYDAKHVPRWGNKHSALQE